MESKSEYEALKAQKRALGERMRATPEGKEKWERTLAKAREGRGKTRVAKIEACAQAARQKCAEKFVVRSVLRKKDSDGNYVYQNLKAPSTPYSAFISVKNAEAKAICVGLAGHAKATEEDTRKPLPSQYLKSDAKNKNVAFVSQRVTKKGIKNIYRFNTVAIIAKWWSEIPKDSKADFATPQRLAFNSLSKDGKAAANRARREAIMKIASDKGL